MYVIKKQDATVSLDGPELCREYCRTDKLWFGTSTLHPGQTGGIDPGHPGAHETFFVSQGEVVVRNPADNKCYSLSQGDLLLIEEGEPHEITNVGEEMAVISWCGAPT